MRAHTTPQKIHDLLVALGQAAKGEGCIYLAGGASALLSGWRQTTLDVDLKLFPEPAGVFEAIRRLKDELDINIELASPDDFIAAVPGWQERSILIGVFGKIRVYHFDFVTQALAKLERGHTQDLADVRAMVERELVSPQHLRDGFDAAEPGLVRYPAVDVEAFRIKLERFLGELDAAR